MTGSTSCSTSLKNATYATRGVSESEEDIGCGVDGSLLRKTLCSSSLPGGWHWQDSVARAKQRSCFCYHTKPREW